MILPPYFAKLAARGQATIGLVPVRQAKTARRKNGTTYTTQPWTPTTGAREQLQTRFKTKPDTCPACNLDLEPSPTRKNWLWCWNCGHHESQADKTRSLAPIVIRAHETIRLGRLLDPDPDAFTLIRATGVKTRATFAHEWMRHHDPNWPPLTEELCPNCEGHKKLEDGQDCEDCDPVGVILIDHTPPDEVILNRFRSRHASTLVHLVTFELDKTDHLRLLSPAGKPRGDDHGYTANPSDAMSGSSDPGEAVPAKLQDEFSKQARERDDQLRKQRGEGRDLRNQRRYQQRKAAA